MTDRFGTARLAVALVAVLVIGACSSPGPGVARGEAVFDTCVPCHGSAGEGDLALGAPAIAGLPQWYIQGQLEKYQEGTRGAHPQDTVGIRMKSMSLSLDLEGDMESISEYVASLPVLDLPATLEGGDASVGEELFTTSPDGGGLACVGCHLQGAVGLEATGAPPLVGQHDWYLLSQFQKYQRGWRGTSPNDPMARNMATAAMQYDEQQVRNIIAYLETLPLPSPQTEESGQ